MRKCRQGISLFLFFAVIFLAFPSTAYATSDESIENEVDESNNNRFDTTSPWLKGTQDDSIYSNPIDAGEENQDISVNKPGRVEKYIAELLRNIGSAVISLLQDSIGASLDSIIYGRVGSGQPNKVNIYAFELRKGNPYGVTASVCYALLRGMMFIFLGIIFIFQMAKAAWSGQTAKSRDEFKSMLPTMVLKFSVLVLMPHLLDVALYVRDILLYGIKEVTAQMIAGGASLSLSKAFLINAERSGTFVDAVMYLGTVVLTVYFVFLYVAVAIDMLVCFVSFPFICVLQSRKRDLIGEWIMTVFSNLMTPVIDAVLLLIPLLTSLMLSDAIKGVSVIQLVMCMLLIPARIRFKALLGIQSNERNGFLGAMAAVTLARAIGSRIKQGAGKIAEAVSDARKSRTYGELAEVDKNEEEAYLSSAGFDRNGKKDRITENITANPSFASRNAEDMENFNNIKETPAFETGKIPEPDIGEENLEVSMDFASGKPERDSFSVKEEEPEDIPVDLQGTDTTAQMQNKNDLLRMVDQEVVQTQGNIDGLRMERSGLVQKDRQLKREMLEHKKGSAQYLGLEKEKADIESQTAEIDGRIAAETGKLNRLRQQSKELHSVIGIFRTPTSFEDQRAEIIRKRANISNFEQPEFKNLLSNAQMRDLYRKRAAVNAVKVISGAGGAVAAGTIAGGSAVFLGASASALSAAGGLHSGGTVGELSVDAVVGAMELGRKSAPALKRAGKSAYTAADMAASAYLMNRVRPMAMQMPLYKEETEFATENMEEINMSAEDQKTYGKQKIQADVFYAVQRILSTEGALKNSTAIRAMQQANLKAEKEIAIIKEENVVCVTEEMIREKRIQAQADALSETIISQLVACKGYEKDSAGYQEAVKITQEKVKQILEEKNRPLL